MKANKTIECILKRRSCREYSNRKVKDEVLNEIVNCGAYAPSGKNKQSTSLLVITNTKIINKMRRASQKEFNRDCFYGAKTFVLVYGAKDNSFIFQDGSCMMENLMVAATAMKVNSCWINQVNDLLNQPSCKKLKEELGLNENDYVIGTCILGYSKSKEEIPAKPRKENHVRYIK